MTSALPPAPSHFEALVDPVKAGSARRWNAGFIVTGSLLLAASAVGVAVMLATGFGSWFTVVLVAVLGVLSISLVVTSVLRGRILRLLTGSGAVACRIDDRGVVLANSPAIPWSEVVFVGVLNDRARTARLRAVPVFGWFGSLALKAGNGTILCEIAVRDGESLRAGIPDRGAARRISLYGRWPDGMRHGLLPLLLDSVLSEETSQAVVRALFSEAQARGIPFSMHESTFGFLKWKGPLLDPEWPTAL
ncbi:hypothetical protein BJ978_001774 [Agromyces terreus]|uniref:Uncharacterized protein n=1 Tax=Agromyces terreus TaxID=424795 RepID=A0A9X2H170_9MICO|nr:hypothetical protein [Agromyces terreus]MCP2371098.1 hypothetical protein [Agromyces terreus]